jgi:sulfate adenylyltransferase subunit 2
MNHLDQLEAESVFVLREAFNRFSNPAMLWSLGKDSNTMIWLARKAFFGHLPFPLAHVDTGLEFPEVYEFREHYSEEWGARLIVRDCPPIEEMDASLPPAARSAARKTAGLKLLIEENSFDGIIAGIRRDEQAVRGKERVFSPRSEGAEWDFRDQPPEFWGQFNTEFPPETHVRIHPLLNWQEIDIWEYTKREDIPLVPLYFARDGKRFRSLGESDITFPVDSEASTIDEIIAELRTTQVSERAGRSMDHEAEDSFERLRKAGYM